jgi:hypothetical protein
MGKFLGFGFRPYGFIPLYGFELYYTLLGVLRAS